MAINRLHIEDFLEQSAGHPLLDVRSPAEFQHAHIPGAISLPLFSNEERAAVGTAYKQESRERAIKIGLDFFGPKMKGLVEVVEHITGQNNSRQVFLYCWRGGMRSGAVAWLLDLYGFRVHTLAGGYKQFRTLVLNTFKKPFPLHIVGGYTGSGKTEILKELQKKGEAIVDLETLASHKGSAFGNIGMPPQPGQEMFENLLALELEAQLQKGTGKLWLEDESQRIGHVNIPNDFWEQMRHSPLYFLDIPFEERLDHLVAEYGTLDRDRMIHAIGRISKRLGGLEAGRALEFLHEGKTRESFRILLNYYDKWYLRGLHNRENLNSLLRTVPCDSVKPENAGKLVPQPEYYENT